MKSKQTEKAGKQPQRRVSAHERLESLPEVFTFSTLTRVIGGDKKKSTVYVNRWKKSGLIKPLGPRVGIYYNLVKNPRADKDKSLYAIKLLFPEAVLSGVTVLHNDAVTTQVPYNIDINILTRRSVPKVEGFLIHCRPKTWFHQFRDLLEPFVPLMKMKPEFALADAWKYGIWRPDPDDIDFDELNVDLLSKTFKRLKYPYPEHYPKPGVSKYLYLL